MKSIDDPSRSCELQTLIGRKRSLRAWYEEVYRRYADCLRRSPDKGRALEIGSGAGFVKQILPEIVTTDVLPYSTVELVLDAARIPLADCSLRMIGMLNVFHHLPDVVAFLSEAERTLVPGGRLLIVDQYPGWLGHLVYRYLHHEHYDPGAVEWQFESSGPLSGANGALAWMVFIRDRLRFERTFPQLRLEQIRTHTPLRYWLAGGLKSWSLLPGWSFPAATRFDHLLTRAFPNSASFMDIELVKAGEVA